MTVGFHSPLPPARTGVADYSAALLAELRKFGRVAMAPRRADVRLYHLGNNPLHADVYERAIAEPGVAVLHDAVLNHFFLGRFDEPAYLDEFVFNYGDWKRDLASDLWRRRARSGLDRRYFEFPMLRRVVERSRAVVVHNPGAAMIARTHGAREVIEIPHLFMPPAVPYGRSPREQWGVQPSAFVFGVFGYLRESKRLMTVLRAFARLRSGRPRTALLVAGEFVSSDLARAAGPLLRGPGIMRLPHLPEADFWRVASAVDACINLRDPAAGETSGIAIRLMGIGKPVLVTTGPETSAFPEDGCVRIEPGPAEADSLLHHLILLTSIPDAARQIGLRGAAHIALHHSAAGAAELYWNTLCAHRT